MYFIELLFIFQIKAPKFLLVTEKKIENFYVINGTKKYYSHTAFYFLKDVIYVVNKNKFNYVVNYC